MSGDTFELISRAQSGDKLAAERLIEENTGVETRIAEEAVRCVGIGTGRSFEQMDELKEGFQNAATYSH